MKARTINEVINSFKKRLVALSSPLANFNSYSNTYILFRAIASVLTEQDTRMLNSINESFLSTATGRNLDRRAEDFGFYRTGGSKAKGSILIKSNRDLVIKRGSILSNASNSAQYELIHDVQVKAGETPGKIISIAYGSIFNLTAGTKLYSSIYDLDITIGYTRDPLTDRALGDLVDGRTQETDEEFRSRILSVIRRDKSDTGSLSYIRDNLLRLSYISKVFIYNHKPVPGYFSVYVDTRDSKHINSISNVIDSIKPVGSLALVKPLKLASVSIKVECEGVSSVNAQSVKDSISSSIYEYMSSLSLGQPLLISELKNICYQNYPKSRVVSPVTDIFIDSESLLSLSSLQVLV